MLPRSSVVKTGNTNLTEWKKTVYNNEYKIAIGSYVAYNFTIQGRNLQKPPSFIDLEGSFFFLPYREEPAAARRSGPSDSSPCTRILLLYD